MALGGFLDKILGRTDTASQQTSTTSDSNVKQEQSTVSQGSQTSQTGGVQAGQTSGNVRTLDQASYDAIQGMLQSIAGQGVLGGDRTNAVLDQLSSAAGELQGGQASRDNVTAALEAINKNAQQSFTNATQGAQRNLRTQAGSSLNTTAQASFDRSAAEAATTLGGTQAQAMLAAEELLAGLDASRITGLTDAAGALADVGGGQSVDALAALGGILKGANVETSETSRAENVNVSNTEQQMLEFLRTLQEGKTTQVGSSSGETNQGFDAGGFITQFLLG